MNASATSYRYQGKPFSRTLLATAISLSVASLVACGGSSDSGGNGADPGFLPLDDDSNLRPLDVSFSIPERLKQIGVALTATVTAGGTGQNMEELDGTFESTLGLPGDQQLQVYVGVRRAEDDLLLAAADTTAWLGDEGSTISLPEQLFSYAFDQDGDGVDNIVEIERGTSPTSLSLDFDADGLPDDSDRDDDNDGVADEFDAFPFNGQEFEDTDNDGIGNRSDRDDDNDGVPDENDAFPTDASETRDTDADGIGDNMDTDADGNGIEDDQEDSDYDGVPDPIDLFPNDYYESADADGDGIGDNADPDDNNDGIHDYREGSQIIVPYVDNASINVDGRWETGYQNNQYYDEWGKAVDNDTYGYSLRLGNLQVDNTGRYGQYSYSSNYFEMMHDGEYLYVKITIGDEELDDWFNDSVDMWDDDSVELYFDVGYDQAEAFGDDDFQRLFRFRDDVADPTIDGYYSAAGMETEHVTSYRHENNASSVYQQLYEIRVKLSSIGLVPGDTFGLEVAVNTDNDGGDRDVKWGWWAPIGTDEAWQNPSVFGKAKLQPSD
ncbi:sugar-binding protein [Granulosicoccus sp. 3-233]|uniref:sugar-binding protein n=1 Tax=Granulosicoccus sp. 3-233 TaxID=3417969 RepID=UPI003D339826